MAAFMQSYRSGTALVRFTAGALKNRQSLTAATSIRCHAFHFGGAGGSGSGGIGRRFSGGNGDGGSSSNGPHRLGWLGSLAASLMVTSTIQVAFAEEAHAAKKETKRKGELTVDDAADALWNVAGPILSNLGFSGVMGLITGAALKKLGSAMAVVIGSLFALLQGLAYAGIITVHWSKVHESVTKTLDVNKDGKLDHADFKIMTSQGLGVLAQGVPSVGGFLAGFLMGVKMF